MWGGASGEALLDDLQEVVDMDVGGIGGGFDGAAAMASAPHFEVGALVRVLPVTNGGGNTAQQLSVGIPLAQVVGSLARRDCRGGGFFAACYPRASRTPSVSRATEKRPVFWPADYLMQACTSGSSTLFMSNSRSAAKKAQVQSDAAARPTVLE